MDNKIRILKKELKKTKIMQNYSKLLQAIKCNKDQNRNEDRKESRI